MQVLEKTRMISSVSVLYSIVDVLGRDAAELVGAVKSGWDDAGCPAGRFIISVRFQPREKDVDSPPE